MTRVEARIAAAALERGEAQAFMSLIEEAHGPNSYVSLLGLKTFDSDKLVKSVERGLSFHTFERFQRTVGVASSVITDVMDLAARTFTRRRKKGRLSRDESDKLLRITRLFANALVLFEGNTAAARQWLSSPQRAAGGAVPLELARTEVGAREVERLLGRMEHGVVS